MLTSFRLHARRFWEGIYVLYDYSAPRTASQQVQKYLSTPIAGNELNILRCVSRWSRSKHGMMSYVWLQNSPGSFDSSQSCHCLELCS